MLIRRPLACLISCVGLSVEPSDKTFHHHALKQRIAAAEVTLRYVPDANMPADFLTKWIPAAKFATSIAYVTNSRALGAFSHPSD